MSREEPSCKVEFWLGWWYAELPVCLVAWCMSLSYAFCFSLCKVCGRLMSGRRVVHSVQTLHRLSIDHADDLTGVLQQEPLNIEAFSLRWVADPLTRVNKCHCLPENLDWYTDLCLYYVFAWKSGYALTLICLISKVLSLLPLWKQTLRNLRVLFCVSCHSPWCCVLVLILESFLTFPWFLTVWNLPAHTPGLDLLRLRVCLAFSWGFDPGVRYCLYKKMISVISVHY